MDAHPEHMKRGEQSSQVFGPQLFFDDVLDDEIVAGRRERSDGAMKSVEEAIALCGRMLRGRARPEAGVGELIGGVVAEGFAEVGLERPGEGCLAGAGGAV